MHSHFEINSLVATISVVTGLATIAVALRFYTRFYLLRLVAAEDYTVGASLFLSIVNTILSSIQVKLALESVPSGPEAATALAIKNGKLLYSILPIFSVSLTLMKVSILQQYLRLFSEKRNFRWSCWFVLAVILAYGGYLLFGALFGCTPIAYTWDKRIQNGRCLPAKPQFLVAAAGGPITDAAIFILPIPTISKLHLPRKQKYGLMAIFTVGLFGCIVSVVKVFKIVEALQLQDPPWDLATISEWSTIELNVGIVCACLTPLRPLIQRAIPWFLNDIISRAIPKTTSVRLSSFEEGTPKKTRIPILPFWRERSNKAKAKNGSLVTIAKVDELPLAWAEENSLHHAIQGQHNTSAEDICTKH